jgi:hypothetical protein
MRDRFERGEKMIKNKVGIDDQNEVIRLREEVKRLKR